MAFFKKTKMKINGKWYPRSITVGKPVTTEEIAKIIATQCTATPSDTYAVLKALGGVMSMSMENGRTVKLDGLGTFYYTSLAKGKGVDSPEKVNASQITDVRVRFISEKHLSSSHEVTTRSLVSDSIFWEEWNGKVTPNPDDPGDKPDPDDPEAPDPM